MLANRSLSDSRGGALVSVSNLTSAVWAETEAMMQESEKQAKAEAQTVADGLVKKYT